MIDRQSEDVEDVLDRFRRWLEAARDEAGRPAGIGSASPGRTAERRAAAPSSAWSSWSRSSRRCGTS